MSIFNSTDYRVIVKSLVAKDKEQGGTLNFQNLAEKMRIPKSYMSKVIAGHADFSSDQMYLIGKLFELTAQECKYLLMLLEHERCSLWSYPCQTGHKVNLKLAA